MTAPTAPGTSDPSLALQTLLDGPQRRSDLAVMQWLMRVRRADLTHPWVRRWAMPLLCAILGATAVRDSADGIGPGVPTMLGLTAGLCVPLLWRTRQPVLIFALTSAVSLVALALDADTASEAARIVALLNVGRSVRPVQLALCLAVAVAQTSVSVVVRGGQSSDLQTPVLAIVQSALVAAVAAAGLVTRVVNAYIAALQERAKRLEVERDQRARLAAAAERARVAGEMHDILGHTLAVIVGLAGGAAGLTENNPQRGAETLRIIADSGRGALAELRRLLAVIDDEQDTPGDTPLAPQPSLADLRPLLDRVRAAGPTLTLHADGDATGLAPGLQLAVYRVLQEALTNTLKHAGPDTTVHVTVTVDDTAVRLVVEDTGPPRTPPPPAGEEDGGQGLVGMRERVALYGGTFAAGPNPRGGWTVRAHFLPTTTPPPVTEKRLA